MPIMFSALPELCPLCDGVMVGLDDVIGLQVARYTCGLQVSQVSGGSGSGEWKVVNGCDRLGTAKTTVMPLTLEAVLARMYASEISCRLSCFWDAGWDVWLGDEMNGWAEKGWVKDGGVVGEVASFLHAMILRHYPDSTYAKETPNA